MNYQLCSILILYNGTIFTLVCTKEIEYHQSDIFLYSFNFFRTLPFNTFHFRSISMYDCQVKYFLNLFQFIPNVYVVSIFCFLSEELWIFSVSKEF